MCLGGTASTDGPVFIKSTTSYDAALYSNRCDSLEVKKRFYDDVVMYEHILDGNRYPVHSVFYECQIPGTYKRLPSLAEVIIP